MTLHREGLLKPMLLGVTNCSRLGPLGFARDFPARTFSDVRHDDRLRAAIVATRSVEVAPALDSYRRTEVVNEVARPTGYAELADAVRGGTAHRVGMTVEDGYDRATRNRGSLSSGAGTETRAGPSYTA